jgi:MoaA/NifB/PqqE/SkfB family radical SAM enzyme
MTISENEPDQSNYLFRSQNDSFEIRGISTETIDNVTSELIRLRKDRFGLTNSSRFLQDYRTFLFTGNQSWRCEAGLLSLDILPDGSVAVCKEKEPIGNILDQNFEAYYRSRAYRDRARSISEACSGCFYGEYREPQYAIRDYRVLQEWIRDWFRVFRHGMRFHSPESNSISLNP